MAKMSDLPQDSQTTNISGFSQSASTYSYINNYGYYAGSVISSAVGRTSNILLWPFISQTNTQELTMKRNKLSVKEHARKENISITTNEISSLPDHLDEWKKVRVLRLTRNIYKEGDGLTELPQSLGNLSTLEILDLRGNPLKTISAPILMLTNLKELNMENCKIDQIPSTMDCLACLTKLNLDNNEISNPKFEPLQSVQELSLSNNCIEKITETLPSTLIKLDLSENFLKLLPSSIFNNLKLKKLYLRQNDLEYLPLSITSIDTLEVLDASKNKLKNLPKEIGKLSNLVICNISYNNLTALPYSITKLEKIHKDRLLCGENPLQKPPVEVALKGLNSIKNYYKALEASPGHHSRRLKFMILGDAKAGKTSVAQAIDTCTEWEHCHQKTTIGIDLVTWKANPLESNPLEILIVDCAGQKKYLMTHQLFLSIGMLFGIVVDVSKYEMSEESFSSKVGYWMDLIICKVPKAVILIVPTHIDLIYEEIDLRNRCEHIINHSKLYIKSRQEHCKKGTFKELDCLIEPVLPKDYIFGGRDSSVIGDNRTDNNIYMIPVSNKNPLVGLKELRSEIIRIANNEVLCPNVHRFVPENWTALERLCMDEKFSRKNPLISVSDLQKKATCFESTTALIEALKYIDSVGPVIYFHDIGLDFVVLNPEWLLQLLKLVFRHDSDKVLVFTNEFKRYKMFEKEFYQEKKFLTDSALLSRKLLRCIWGERVSDEELFNVVIKLFQQCDLVYDIELLSLGPKKKQLLVPWYFKEECPVPIHDPPLTEKSRVVTLMEIQGVLPDGFFQRFIIRVYSLNLLRDCIPWSTGFKGLSSYGEIICRHQKLTSHSGNIILETRSDHDCTYHSWLVIIPILNVLKQFLKEWEGISHCLYSMCPKCYMMNPNLNTGLWILNIEEPWYSTEKLSCHFDMHVVDQAVIFPPKGILISLEKNIDKSVQIYTDPLTREEKVKIAGFFGNRTKELCKVLNVLEGALDPIHPGTNYQDRAFDIILKWEEKNQDISKGLFMELLRSMFPYPKDIDDMLL